MAPRTRRPRRTVAAKPSVDAGPAAAVVANLAALLDENRSLRKEVDRLRGLIERVATLTAGGAAAVAEVTAPRRRGRPRRVDAVAEPVAATPRVKKPRRKITDPDLLERRRAALAKARAVRAERLAAARAE